SVPRQGAQADPRSLPRRARRARRAGAAAGVAEAATGSAGKRLAMTKPVGKLRIADRKGKYKFRATRAVSRFSRRSCLTDQARGQATGFEPIQHLLPSTLGSLRLELLPASVRPTSARTTLPQICFGHIDRRTEPHGDTPDTTWSREGHSP